MPVMPFDHSCVGVPEITRHDHKRYAVPNRKARARVSKWVKATSRFDLGVTAGFDHRPRLRRLGPGLTVVARKHKARPARTM